MEFTESKEMYLKIIFRLSKSNGDVRITDIARRLRVSKASANKAVKILAGEGYLNYTPYRHIELTDKGNEAAEKVCERQEIIADYLIMALHVAPRIALEEACRMEHVVGLAVIDKMKDTISCSRAARERKYAEKDIKKYTRPAGLLGQSDTLFYEYRTQADGRAGIERDSF